MMLDADVVAVSPSSVYRVLKAAGRMRPIYRQALQKGQGLRPAPACPTSTGTSTSATSTSAARSTICAAILDGYSRFIVHWEIREA